MDLPLRPALPVPVPRFELDGRDFTFALTAAPRPVVRRDRNGERIKDDLGRFYRKALFALHPLELADVRFLQALNRRRVEFVYGNKRGWTTLEIIVCTAADETPSGTVRVYACDTCWRASTL